MTPEFSNLVNPTFNYVLDLAERIERREPVDLKFERDRIRSELDDAEMSARSPQHPVKEEDFELAKRALVFWADDVLTMATVNDEQPWAGQTLEREIYGERERAIRFYEDAEKRARRANPDVLEVFYLAMVLGFRGDILDAFRRMGKPFPPEVSEEEARAQWGAELARQIPQRQTKDLPAPALGGDVRPLWGAEMLRTAVQWFAALLVALGILLVFWMRGNN
jgi:type VI secretion system protein ImpK